MKRYIKLLFLLPILGYTNQIKVAVIDTGISLGMENVMCPHGNEDFSGEGLYDTIGHGTHISSLIDMHVTGKNTLSVYKESLSIKRQDYCQVILKFYSESASSKQNIANTVKAINKAIALKVDFINYSGGGSEQDPLEKSAIKKALRAGIKIIVAAGNDGHAFNTPHPYIGTYTYFPAMYDPRLIVVGNMTSKGKRHPSSNFDNNTMYIDAWEIGENVVGLGKGLKSETMTGTSQSTAVHTGKLIRRILVKQ
jgi:subtilisin family serine protease